jgi:hypothetical protein
MYAFGAYILCAFKLMFTYVKYDEPDNSVVSTVCD